MVIKCVDGAQVLGDMGGEGQGAVGTSWEVQAISEMPMRKRKKIHEVKGFQFMVIVLQVCFLHLHLRCPIITCKLTGYADCLVPPQTY